MMDPLFDFTGKVVLVTGGSRGLGYHMVKAFAELASQVAHRMNQGEGGCIINISSIASLQPAPQVVPYGGAKAALNQMSVSLAREYAPKVRVNTIAPGPFLTDIAEAWVPEKREKQPVAMGRPGYSEEIVTAALMLASPHSSYTTGALIRVDGGQ
ncbi:MAG: SDR family oxidoreductase [Novosphingobium sp.]|nr:SDR family oxidoreductase [Novosphingobium sp.]